MKFVPFFIALFLFSALVSSAQNNFGNALLLDGDGDFVDVPDHESLDIKAGDDFTFSAWFKTTKNAQTRLIYKVATGPSGYAMFVNFGEVWTITWSPALPAFSVISPPTRLYDDNVWHHAAFVRDGTRMAVYVDGELMQERFDAVSESLENNANLGIGAVPSNAIADPSFFFEGSIDEVRIWKVARSREEIVADMLNPLDASIYDDPASGLAAYYQFEQLEDLGVGAAGTNDVRDLSVNGNHGELIGDARLTFVGEDDFSEPLLTMRFTDMDVHIGDEFKIRVVDQNGDREVGRKRLDAIPASGFDMTLNVLLKDHNYDIDFYADRNGNGAYDAPPVDHAWRVELTPAMGSDVVPFAHNINFTDIDWPPQINGFNYSDYEAIWKGVGQNENGGLDFSIIVRYLSNRADGTVNGYIEATNVFGFFDMILVFFTGAFSDQTQTVEVMPIDDPNGKRGVTLTKSGDGGQSFSFGATDWSGTLINSTSGEMSANFLYSAMGLNIDLSGEGIIGKTQAIVNYHSDHFGVDGKMLVQEDSIISANTSNTAAEEELGTIPNQSVLSQNYPNPGFPNTRIPFYLARPADVTIKLYDILGREVATLLEASMNRGDHEVMFNGAHMPSGMYLFRMKANQSDGTTVEQSKKLVILN
ncbi:MAG: hypothetical protein BMS9Abin05_1036 [Rhodothermia bacterium]|nr:MAG: hypothetical protein BMS9Abin05_1036 [Rhodothermia bacterium]